MQILDRLSQRPNGVVEPPVDDWRRIDVHGANGLGFGSRLLSDEDAWGKDQPDEARPQ
jgi:hypothetical protein